VISPVWILGWLALAIWPADTPRPLVALLVGFLLFASVIIRSFGLEFLKNRLNKSNVLGGGAGVVAALAWTLSAAHLGLGMPETQLGILLVLALTALVVAVTADLRGLPIAAVNFVLFGAASLAPAYARHALAASAVVVAGSLVVNNILLRRRSRASPR
jgi:ABC-type Fe3+-siderophore transport system permease subunit